MSLGEVTYEVTGVIPGDPPRVNVKAGTHGQSITGITVPGGYLNPAIGDVVALAGPPGALYVGCCFTPGRRYTPPFTITLQGSAPAGMDQVSAWYAQAGKAKQPDLVGVYASAPVVAPPGAPGATVQITAASSGTYRDTFGGQWMGDPGVYQGVYDPYGQHSGLWFYGASAFTAPLASVTPTSGSIYVRRKSGSGDYGPVPVYLWLHDHATQPGGAPALALGPVTPVSLAVGAEAEVPIPQSWLAALKAGTAHGFAVTTDSAGYAQYAGRSELDISGRVTINY